jgi:hypothetical protein
MTVVSQAQVGHAGGVGSLQPQPALLHGVVGVGQAAQHPVSNRPHVRPVGLELVGQPALAIPVALGIVTSSRVPPSLVVTDAERAV